MLTGTSRRNRLGAATEGLFLLTAYNLTREWKESGSAAAEEKSTYTARAAMADLMRTIPRKLEHDFQFKFPC